MTALTPGRSRGSLSRKDAVASALLIVALIAASAILVFDFSSFKSPTGRPPQNVVTATQGQTNGELLIVVALSPSVSQDFSVSLPISSVQNGTFVSFIVPLTQLPPVNFTVRSQDGSYPTASLSVSEPGQIEVTRPAGTYIVSTSSVYYNFSVQVPISINLVSELDVSVSQSILQPGFTQVSDPDSSGLIEPWQTLVVQTALTPQAPVQGGTVFLESIPQVDINGTPVILPRHGTSAFYGPSPVRANVLQADSRAGGLWLLLQPKQPLAIGTSNLYLYSIQETHTVSIHA